jgi:hypothetical protein
MANFFVENNVYQATANPGTPIISDPIYTPIGSFAINASNQLIGKLWIIKNGQKMYANLGTASYEFIDGAGNPVPGLSQSGISANADGDYIITPVSAANILDLSHYTVQVDISADSGLRRGQMGVPVGN